MDCIYQPIQKIYMFRKSSNNHKKFLLFLNQFKNLQNLELFNTLHLLSYHCFDKMLLLLAFLTFQINFYIQNKSFSHFFHQNLNSMYQKNIPKYYNHKTLLQVLLQKDLLYFIKFEFYDYHTMSSRQDHLELYKLHLILIIF